LRNVCKPPKKSGTTAQSEKGIREREQKREKAGACKPRRISHARERGIFQKRDLADRGQYRENEEEEGRFLRDDRGGLQNESDSSRSNVENAGKPGLEGSL